MQAERRFISAMFPGAKPATTKSATTKTAISKPTASVQSLTVPAKKVVQSRLTHYFQNREIAKAMKKMISDSDDSSTGSTSSKSKRK